MTSALPPAGKLNETDFRRTSPRWQTSESAREDDPVAIAVRELFDGCTLGLDECMASRADMKPTTRARANSVIKLHIQPHLGHYQLSALNHEIVHKWAADLSLKHGQAPQSV